MLMCVTALRDGLAPRQAHPLLSKVLFPVSQALRPTWGIAGPKERPEGKPDIEPWLWGPG